MKLALKKAKYTQNEDGEGYTGEVPELPGCISWGETIEEARDMIKDAIAGRIITALQLDDPIPESEGKILAGLRNEKFLYPKAKTSQPVSEQPSDRPV